MLIPIRCFECGKVLANKWNAYQTLVKEEESKPTSTEQSSKTPQGTVLDKLGITDYCCRKAMLTNTDLSLNI